MKNIDKNDIEGYNDDIVVDPEETENETVQKLRKKLKECQKEKQEYLLGWQRSKADFINARKQDAGERERTALKAQEVFVLQVLPVLDSFEMAFADTLNWEKVDATWRTGVENIYNQLYSTLSECGVKEINPLGEQFDPSLHDSLKNVSTNDSAQDGEIVTVLQKGYFLNETIIRAPKVEIAQYNKSRSN